MPNARNLGIPDEIIDNYKMKNKVPEDRYIYIYASENLFMDWNNQELLQKIIARILNKEGYNQAKHTKGIWLHKNKNISFTLVVDNYGVKYIHKQGVDRLIKILEKNIPLSVIGMGIIMLASI